MYRCFEHSASLLLFPLEQRSLDVSVSTLNADSNRKRGAESHVTRVGTCHL